MRDTFIETVGELLDTDPRTAVVDAEISADRLADAARRHPDRVVNVGIREQLMLGVAGGMALTGLRPYVHSYAPFLVERAYEQIKIDLDHQGAGAVLVSIGASYDRSASGRTHHSPADVALIDTLDGWTVHVPGHRAEVAPLLRAAAHHDDRVYMRLSEQHNADPHPGAGITAIRPGGAVTVLAVGPVLDAVLAASTGLDVGVGYTHTPRPFDSAGLRALLATRTGGADAAVVLVEPYLAGTSAWCVAAALADTPHRLLALGVGRTDPRIYGEVSDHDRAHRLDPAGLRAAIIAFG